MVKSRQERICVELHQKIKDIKTQFFKRYGINLTFGEASKIYYANTQNRKVEVSQGNKKIIVT